MSLMTPNTLLLPGSMTVTSSPAALVWITRSLFAPDSDTNNSGAARIITLRVFITLCSLALSLLFAAQFFATYPGRERLPLGVTLRLPVFAARMERIAARLDRQRVR